MREKDKERDNMKKKTADAQLFTLLLWYYKYDQNCVFFDFSMFHNLSHLIHTTSQNSHVGNKNITLKVRQN